MVAFRIFKVLIVVPVSIPIGSASDPYNAIINGPFGKLVR